MFGLQRAFARRLGYQSERELPNEALVVPDALLLDTVKIGIEHFNLEAKSCCYYDYYYQIHLSTPACQRLRLFVDSSQPTAPHLQSRRF
jgi:hypothetical protein